MHRIFLLESDLKTGILNITDEKARYLSNVLRCRTGSNLIVTDNRGNSYIAKIIRTNKKELTIEVIDKQDFNTESPLHLTLLQAILKGEKMDLVIQKATELGVTEIVPVITERSQIRETRKLPRWRKIAEESSRQSGRNHIPAIHEASDLKEIFKYPKKVSENSILLWEKGGETLSDIVCRFYSKAKITILTGPEGGFSEREVMAAFENGYAVATLGPRILRAETSAIAVIAILQYESGDIGHCRLKDSA